MSAAGEGVPRVRSLCAAVPQPWVNGGGVTRELLAAPGAGAWRWRISLAEIARDGAFSPYPGVERWLALVEGSGIELDFKGQGLRCLRDDEPLRFDGAQAPHCRLLAGPTRDLNLMLRGVEGSMQRARSGEAWAPRARQAGLYTAGACTVNASRTTRPAPAQSLLWFDAAPATLVLDAPRGTVAWWIAVDDDTLAPR